MNKVHLLCSTNWNPNFAEADPDRMLAPLRTMIDYLSANHLNLSKVILLRGDDPTDFDFCALVQRDFQNAGLMVDIENLQCVESSPDRVGRYVSRASEEANLVEADLWVDLTPGPKQRSATIFAAASAVPGVRIVYSQAVGSDRFEVRTLAPLGSYNQWLGQHGIRIRNYFEELRGLAELEEGRQRGQSPQLLRAAVSDLLGAQIGGELPAVGPRAGLLTLAEWVSLEASPKYLFGVDNPQRASGQLDEILKSINQTDRNDSKKKSKVYASQFLYQLRCIFAHKQPEAEDSIALLDCLAFLAASLKTHRGFVVEPEQSLIDKMYIAVDGDDVGRRFEERLARCVDIQDVSALRQWSQRIQQDLSGCMVKIMELGSGWFVARTGDGFLATFPSDRFDAIKATFRPNLEDATVTTGVGRSVKEAYVALKLGKARNRGGGLFFSFDPPREEVLW